MKLLLVLALVALGCSPLNSTLDGGTVDAGSVDAGSTLECLTQQPTRLWDQVVSIQPVPVTFSMASAAFIRDQARMAYARPSSLTQASLVAADIRAAGTATELAADLPAGCCKALTAGNSHLYFFTGGPASALLRLPLAGGASETLLTGVDAVPGAPILVDSSFGTDVIWVLAQHPTPADLEHPVVVRLHRLDGTGDHILLEDQVSSPGSVNIRGGLVMTGTDGTFVAVPSARLEQEVPNALYRVDAFGDSMVTVDQVNLGYNVSCSALSYWQRLVCIRDARITATAVTEDHGVYFLDVDQPDDVSRHQPLFVPNRVVRGPSVPTSYDTILPIWTQRDEVFMAVLAVYAGGGLHAVVEFPWRRPGGPCS